MGTVSFVGASTFSPVSSESSSSSAYCERLSSAFDGLSSVGLDGVGFDRDTASISLFRRSACGSRAAKTDSVGKALILSFPSIVHLFA